MQNNSDIVVKEGDAKVVVDKTKKKGKNAEAEVHDDDAAALPDADILLESMTSTSAVPINEDGSPATALPTAGPSEVSKLDHAVPYVMSDTRFKFSSVPRTHSNYWIPTPFVVTAGPLGAGQASVRSDTIFTDRVSVNNLDLDLGLDTASEDLLRAYSLANVNECFMNPFEPLDRNAFVCASDGVCIEYSSADDIGSYVDHIMDRSHPTVTASNPMRVQKVLELEGLMRRNRVAPVPVPPNIASPVVPVLVMRRNKTVIDRRRTNGIALFSRLSDLATDAAADYRVITGDIYTVRRVAEVNNHYVYAPFARIGVVRPSEMVLRTAMYFHTGMAADLIPNLKLRVGEHLSEVWNMYSRPVNYGSNLIAATAGNSGDRAAATHVNMFLASGSFSDFWNTVLAYMVAGHGARFVIPQVVGHVDRELDAYLMLRCLFPVDCFVDGAVLDTLVTTHYATIPGAAVEVAAILADGGAFERVIKVPAVGGGVPVYGLDRFKVTVADVVAAQLPGGVLPPTLRALQRMVAMAVRNGRGNPAAIVFKQMYKSLAGMLPLLERLLAVAGIHAQDLRLMSPSAPAIVIGAGMQADYTVEVTLAASSILRGFLEAQHVMDVSKPGATAVLDARLRDRARTLKFDIAARNLPTKVELRTTNYAVCRYMDYYRGLVAVLIAAGIQMTATHWSACSLLSRQLLCSFMDIPDLDAFIRVVTVVTCMEEYVLPTAAPLFPSVLTPADVAFTLATLPLVRVNPYFENAPTQFPYVRLLPPPGGFNQPQNFPISNLRFHAQHGMSKVQTVGYLQDAVLVSRRYDTGPYYLVNPEDTQVLMTMTDFSVHNPSNHSRALPIMVESRLGALAAAALQGSVIFKTSTKFRLINVHIDADDDEVSLRITAALQFNADACAFNVVSTRNGTVKAVEFPEIPVLSFTTTYLTPIALRAILMRYAGRGLYISPHSRFLDAAFSDTYVEDPAVYVPLARVQALPPPVIADGVGQPVLPPPVINNALGLAVPVWQDPFDLVADFVNVTGMGSSVAVVPHTNMVRLFDATVGTAQLLRHISESVPTPPLVTVPAYADPSPITTQSLTQV